jgi:AhpC/TSA family protein
MLMTGRALGMFVSGAAMTLLSLGHPGPSAALEVGQPAPDFSLPSTTGPDITLGEFKGKKWVFLEFYGSDFAPT